jgi:hypothetical protein
MGLALILHFGIYAPSLQNAFTFDDRKIVLENLYEKGPVSLPALFVRGYFPRQESRGIDYRPLALTSLALDLRLFGPNVTAMRAENLLWAGLGAGLCALVAGAASRSIAIAALTALLVSVHPVRSEAIVSIVGRSELMSFALVCGALLCALLSWRGSRAWAVLSGVLLLAALLSKETAFAAAGPLAALLVVDRRRVQFRGAAIVLIAWVAAYSIAFSARASVLGGVLKSPESRIDATENQLSSFRPPARIRAALALVPLATERLLWPSTLVGDYGTRTFTDRELSSNRAAILGAVLLGVTLVSGAWLTFRRNPVGLGLLWALFVYLPYCNVLFVTGFAFTERVLFAPAAAVALCVAGLFAELAAKSRRSLAVVIILSILISWLGAWRIARRLPDWQDDETLFRSVVRDRPTNGRAWLNLGVIDLSREDAAAAEVDLIAALRADPSLEPNVRWMLEHASSIRKPRLEAVIRRALARAL